MRRDALCWTASPEKRADPERALRGPRDDAAGRDQNLVILEAANLVTRVQACREKLHYLNPVPIHQIGERWIRKFERGKLTALSELKRQLEKRDE